MEAQAEQEGSSVKGASSQRILWVGDLKDWMDEEYLRCYYAYYALNNDLISIRVMRNRKGEPMGYGFLEFSSHDAAARVLQAHRAVRQLPRTQKIFKLNWEVPNRKKGPTFDIFVGGLSPVVTPDILKQVFSTKYVSVKRTDVVINRFTGISRGIGFVRFGDEMDQVQALNEMNGFLCCGKPIRVERARKEEIRG